MFPILKSRYILEMTDNHHMVLNFTDFNLLNESHTFGKKNLGIIGEINLITSFAFKAHFITALKPANGQ